MTLQINYLDRDGNVVGSHLTADPFTTEERAKWSDWLNDRALDHPGAPTSWDQFELVGTE